MNKAIIRTFQAVFTIGVLIWVFHSPEKRAQGMFMSWRRATMLFFVGLFFNLFMPGYTGGDFARLYYLMREFPQKKKEAILTVVMDRLIGVAALFVTAVFTTTLRWQWLQKTPQATVLLWVLIAMLVGFV